MTVSHIEIYVLHNFAMPRKEDIEMTNCNLYTKKVCHNTKTVKTNKDKIL